MLLRVGEKGVGSEFMHLDNQRILHIYDEADSLAWLRMVSKVPKKTLLLCSTLLPFSPGKSRPIASIPRDAEPEIKVLLLEMTIKK